MSKEEFEKLIKAQKAWAARGSTVDDPKRSMPRRHCTILRRDGETSEQALARAKSMGIL